MNTKRQWIEARVDSTKMGESGKLELENRPAIANIAAHIVRTWGGVRRAPIDLPWIGGSNTVRRSLRGRPNPRRVPPQKARMNPISLPSRRYNEMSSSEDPVRHTTMSANRNRDPIVKTILPAESRNLVQNVRWETYVALSEDRRGSVPRITYDRGEMELMSPRKEHEKIKTLLGRIVAAYAECRNIEIESVASTTFRREDLDRGFEADESYYIQHADHVRSKVEIDLTIDPPPDLVIEVEITSSAIRKLNLFAAIGVPEVWRHDGSRLRVFHLDDKTYNEQNHSTVLPGFPVELAESTIASRLQRGEIALVKEFRSRIEPNE